MPALHCLYLQLYATSERGWGRSANGYTLHTTLQKAKKFVAKWTKEQRDLDQKLSPGLGNSVPEVYDFAEGEPRLVEVSKKVYDACVKAKGNMWGKGDSPTIKNNRLQ